MAGYKEYLAEEQKLRDKLFEVQKLQFEEVKRFIKVKGRENFTLEVWEAIYRKHSKRFHEIDAEFRDLHKQLKKTDLSL